MNYIKYFFLLVLLMTQGCDSKKVEQSNDHLNQGIAFIAALGSETDKGFIQILKNAEVEFTQAINLNPNNYLALMNRGVIYITMGKLNKAELDLKKSKDLSPSSPDVNYNLASLYSLNGKLDLSLEYFGVALKNGFSDYDRIRNDSDLINLREYKGFTEVLETNKVFL